MTTKVRIRKSRNGNYDHLEMQILTNAKYGTYLSPIGSITWQGDHKFGWYAMRFNVDAEPHDTANILAMYKLACYVKERMSDATPAETMAIIGGEEHFTISGQHVSILDNGKQMFDAVRSNGITEIRVIAANAIMAARILEGRIKRNELQSVEYKLIPTGGRIALSLTDLSYATEPKI